MTRLSDLFRNVFRRALTKPRPAVATRARLGILALEDRVVPVIPNITVASLSDAAEDGTNGTFEITRHGNTSGALTVNYLVGGTATGTNNVDYTALSGSVTIASGVATATVDVHAIHDGLIDPDETVEITITSGTGYTIGPEYVEELTVIDTDILPVAFDGWTTTSVNEPVVVEVLDLSTSLYGDTLTTTGVTQGSEGSVVVNQDSTVTYTPGTDFTGDDSFTYTVEDPFGNESTGTITVTVTHPEAPPTSVWTATDTQVTVAVLDMAFDPDGQTLTTVAVSQGLHGGVVLNQDGTLTYTPGTSFTGEDSFTYTVEDPDGNQATNTITVSVGPIDPVTVDDDVATAVNTAAVVDIPDIAFDPAGDTLTVVAITQGIHGTFVNNQDGTVTYTPNSSFSGTDSFTYTVEDNDSNTSIGTITVVVGTPAATETDGTIQDLEDLGEEIENYDEGTPAAIHIALPAIVDSATNYVNEVMSFIRQR